MSRTFALEIGTEEIPAGYLPPASAQLKVALEEGLKERRIAFKRVETFAAPRRLIALVHEIGDGQADLDKVVMGPPAKVAFGPDGALTKAGEGFAKKQGVPVDALRRVETAGGEYLVATVHETGRPLEAVLLEWLPGLIAALSFPKTMKWRGDEFRFARPVRSILALLDAEVLPLVVGPLKAGRVTRGHRLFVTAPVEVATAADLLPTLAKAGVLADPAVRTTRIAAEVARAAAEAQGRAVEDAGLLEEVAYLVEFPTAVLGSFDTEFLALPREVITTAMRSHQRYFGVEDAQGNLLPHFITLANGRWDDASQVVEGNERVLRARLADARFYWDVDLKAGLEKKLEELKTVVWIQGAGSLYERAMRIELLVERLAAHLKSGTGVPVVPAGVLPTALRAAHLAKADLATEMIRDGKEFTALQGIIGGAYAKAGGEPEPVWQAIREHYQPRGPHDPLPSTTAGLLVSLADRFDAIVGCFAMGLTPTGSQDPYALRRAANGVVRILLEQEWHLSIGELVKEAVAQLPKTAQDKTPDGAEGVVTKVRAFFADRLDFFLREKGIPYDVSAATLVVAVDDPLDALARARALAAIRGEADLEKLVSGFKRAANILKGVDDAPAAVDAALMKDAIPVETALYTTALAARQEIDGAIATVDYPRAVRAFLSLRAPIDAFFEGVMVMSTDPTEKARRLGMLFEIKALFDRLYDLSKIVVEGTA